MYWCSTGAVLMYWGSTEVVGCTDAVRMRYLIHALVASLFSKH